LIWQEGWSELDHPDSLLPIVAAIAQYEDHSTSYAFWNAARESEAADLAEQVIEEARRLLGGQWPPSSGPTGEPT
jgi:hypothetical protein